MSIGLVIRINPRELYIKDPYYYDEIYTLAYRKREKDPKFVNIFRFLYSLIVIISYNLYRSRRGLLNNFFSKKSVLEPSPFIYKKESKLIRRFKKYY